MTHAGQPITSGTRYLIGCAALTAKHVRTAREGIAVSITRQHVGAWHASLRVELGERTDGPPTLMLYSEEGPQADRRFGDARAGHCRIVAPSHPGFDGEPRLRQADRPRDLASAYLGTGAA
jgi:hypothetical protein